MVSPSRSPVQGGAGVGSLFRGFHCFFPLISPLLFTNRRTRAWMRSRSFRIRSHAPRARAGGRSHPERGYRRSRLLRSRRAAAHPLPAPCSRWSSPPARSIMASGGHRGWSLAHKPSSSSRARGTRRSKSATESRPRGNSRSSWTVAESGSDSDRSAGLTWSFTADELAAPFFVGGA